MVSVLANDNSNRVACITNGEDIPASLAAIYDDVQFMKDRTSDSGMEAIPARKRYEDDMRLVTLLLSRR